MQGDLVLQTQIGKYTNIRQLGFSQAYNWQKTSLESSLAEVAQLPIVLVWLGSVGSPANEKFATNVRQTTKDQKIIVPMVLTDKVLQKSSLWGTPHCPGSQTAHTHSPGIHQSTWEASAPGSWAGLQAHCVGPALSSEYSLLPQCPAEHSVGVKSSWKWRVYKPYERQAALTLMWSLLRSPL